jgi:phosphatidate phosphatase LPIN
MMMMSEQSQPLTAFTVEPAVDAIDDSKDPSSPPKSVGCCSIFGAAETLGDALDVIVVSGASSADAVASCDFRVKFPSRHVGGRIVIQINGIVCVGVEMVVTKEEGTCKFTDGMSEKPSNEHLLAIKKLLHNERNNLTYYLLKDNGDIIGTSDAHVFLWKSHYNIVVVDIDGTITRSNARGVWDTIITENFEYVHSDICHFFHSFIQDELRVLYLTSRTISMARATRRFLATLEQGGYHMPAGPILGNTRSLASVLLSELVKMDIYQYKADSLFRQVLLVFAGAGRTNTRTLLRCAFGNSPTDSMAYEMAGISCCHIYNIDPSSTISCLDRFELLDTNEGASGLPTMKLARKRGDYKHLFGTTYSGYGDAKLLVDITTKMRATS